MIKLVESFKAHAFKKQSITLNFNSQQYNESAKLEKQYQLSHKKNKSIPPA